MVRIARVAGNTTVPNWLGTAAKRTVCCIRVYMVWSEWYIQYVPWWYSEYKILTSDLCIVLPESVPLCPCLYAERDTGSKPYSPLPHYGIKPLRWSPGRGYCSNWRGWQQLTVSRDHTARSVSSVWNGYSLTLSGRNSNYYVVSRQSSSKEKQRWLKWRRDLLTVGTYNKRTDPESNPIPIIPSGLNWHIFSWHLRGLPLISHTN